MTGDFFDQLDAELQELTRQGAHLAHGEPGHRRRGRLVRRGVLGALLIVALAVSLVSEFPGTASGHAQIVRPLVADRV